MRIVTLALCILGIIASGTRASMAQGRAAFQGYIEEAESGTTLPGAHVFLANTSIGDISDPNGQFAVQDVPAGSYQLLVTMIGYKPLKQVIQLQRDETLTLALKLEKEIYEVGEITVVEQRSKGWKRDLNKFKRVFLGQTPNRKGCEITNPFDIDFKEEYGFFKASASRPIIVENRSLGYKITYLLSHFSMRSGEYRYQGEPVFEDLEPGSAKETRRWEEMRAKTFEGSFAHFLRSLSAGTAHEDGFRTYIIDELRWTDADRDFMQFTRTNKLEVEPHTLIAPGDSPHERRLAFSEYLHIRYENQSMMPEFYRTVHLNYSPSKEPIRSAIELLNIRPVFNELGFLNNSYDVGQYGYWGWEGGVCNLLPFDYGMGTTP